MPRRAKTKEYPSVLAEFRIIIFGDAGVGKSSLLETIMFDNFVENWQSTKEPETYRIIFQTTAGPIRILAVDTVGQERFGARGELMEGIDGVICMFDISARVTCARAKSTLREIDHLEHKIPAVLVANKLDIIGSKYKKFREHCRKQGRHEYIEICVKEKTRVLDPFLALIKKLMNKDELEFLGDQVSVEEGENDPTVGT